MYTPLQWIFGTLRNRYTEILTRDAAPGADLDEHVHEWDVRALILDGAFFVATADGRSDCRTGDTVELSAGVQHTEGAGPKGARLLIGRRHQTP